MASNNPLECGLIGSMQNLNTMGYKPTKSDSLLFIKINNSSTVYILIYVDDLIITRNEEEEVRKLTGYLHKQFSIKDLGSISYFLGIKVKRKSSSEIRRYQKKYISELLTRANMHETKPQTTPMISNQHYSKTGEKPYTI